MNKYKRTLLYMATVCLIACQDNVPAVQNSKQDFEDKTTEAHAKYEISQEEAIANLQDFLLSEEGDTRSNQKRNISSVYPVKASWNTHIIHM